MIAGLLDESQQIVSREVVEVFVAQRIGEEPEHSFPLYFCDVGTSAPTAGPIPLQHVFDRADRLIAHEKASRTHYGTEAFSPLGRTSADGRGIDSTPADEPVNQDRRSLPGTLGRLVSYRIRFALGQQIFGDDAADVAKADEIAMRKWLTARYLAIQHERERERREAGFASTSSRHGTRTRYNAACRCKACVRAHHQARAAIDRVVMTGKESGP